MKRKIIIGLILVIAALACAFFYLGGFKFETADVKEFGKYAQSVDKIEIPEGVEIVALGEATHGNVEFQELKLSVFRQMVEKYGARAFLLEADYSSCLAVNEYIHGGKGTAQEAAKATGFSIYRTKQMAELMTYMREFNEKAKSGDEINLYGIDMQSMEEKLPENASVETAQQYSTCMEQHEELATLYKANKMWGDDGYTAIRDKYMSENLAWVLEREKAAGRNMIFLSAHNGHIAKYAKTTDMGSRLSQKYGDRYYTIGTAFYKTRCTLRNGSRDSFSAHTFFSHDPLAGAAKANSLDICWLDFAKVPKNSALRKHIDDYGKMGELGERFSILNRLLPNTYQLFRCPGQLYNGVIYVTKATPTELID